MHTLLHFLLAAGLASSASAYNPFHLDQLNKPAPTVTVSEPPVVTITAGYTATTTTVVPRSGSAPAISSMSSSYDPYSAYGPYSISDSRTSNDAYTSSCESKLFSDYYGVIDESDESGSGLPTSTNSRPIPTPARGGGLSSYLDKGQDPCYLSFPASLTSDLAVYESSVSSWFATISSSGYVDFFASECPYLSDYQFAIISGRFMPIECTKVLSDLATATATGSGSGSGSGSAPASAAATATGSAAKTGSASGSASGSATGTATGSATGTASTASATVNAGPRETGIIGMAAVAAGFVGAVAAL